MKQLTIIACSYGSVSAVSTALGARFELIVLIVLAGLAHAAIAGWFGIKRGAQHPERGAEHGDGDEPQPPTQIGA